MTREQIVEEIKQKEIQVSSIKDRITFLKKELQEKDKNQTLENMQLGNIYCKYSPNTKLIVSEAIADVGSDDRRFCLIGREGETFRAWSLSSKYRHDGPYTKKEIADYLNEYDWKLWGKVYTRFDQTKY